MEKDDTRKRYKMGQNKRNQNRKNQDMMSQNTKSRSKKNQDIDWEDLTEEENTEEEALTETGEDFGEAFSGESEEDLEEAFSGEPEDNFGEVFAGEPAHIEEEFEEEFVDDFNEEEEEKFSLKPWMVPAFAGMLILAILICIPLWKLTHREKDAVIAGQETGTDIESVSDTLAEEGTSTQENAGVALGEDAGNQDGLTKPDNAVADAGGQGNAGASPDAGTQTGQGGADAAAVGNEEMQEPISGNASMSFQEVSDSVTAKDVTNLRSVPSTEDSENVVGQLKNGETLARTGVNSDTGWSRLTQNGATVYAVTQYLTTDLTYKPPVTAANPNRVSTLDGRVIIFVDNDDYVTPKEYVNLRTEPSTSEGDSTVRCQVSNGEKLHRTGYSPDSGWSRVEYNGESLYVVSSLVQGVAAE